LIEHITPVFGTFDRAVIEQDSRGRPARALILDYKSDRISADADFRPLVETYRGKMDLYVWRSNMRQH
jgi:hypothetical protein